MVQFLKAYFMKSSSDFCFLAKVIAVAAVLVLLPVTSIAEDWPQWRGPTRNGISRESGLLEKWPDGGPVQLWSVEEDLGQGYSSPSIADGRVFVTGMLESKGVLFAFDLEGVLIWKKEYGAEWSRSWPGTRSTPTIENGKVYVHSGTGVVHCFDARTGKKDWSRDVAEDFEGIPTRWGWAESLLVVEDKLICAPCGKKATLVALNKHTGETVWDKPSLGEISAYCSPTLFERDERKIIAYRTALILFGVDAEDGEMLWHHDCEEFMKPAKPEHVHVNHPLVEGGHLYITSGYDAGGAMFALSESGDAIELKWLDKTLDAHLGGVVLVGGYIYGSNYVKRGSSSWISLSWNTGKALYETNWNDNRGVVIYADGMLYCYGERTGELGLVEAGPEFKVVSSFKIPKTKSRNWWAHPSISDGRLFIRHDNRMMCFDIRAEAE